LKAEEAGIRGKDDKYIERCVCVFRERERETETETETESGSPMNYEKKEGMAMVKQIKKEVEGKALSYPQYKGRLSEMRYHLNKDVRDE
jgi:hypothetical protein